MHCLPRLHTSVKIRQTQAPFMNKQQTFEIDRFPSLTPGGQAYRYLVGYASADMREWWSDFHVKEMAIEKSFALSVAKNLQEVLDTGMKFLPELDSKKKWRVCIVDLKQQNQLFSDK